MNSLPVVSIVIVNHNGGNVLESCLESVRRETVETAYETIIVDNASTDESMQMVSDSFPEVRQIRNTGNAGFASANNQGIAVARGPFVLLLNPDTVICDRAIDRVLAFLRQHPEAGVAGCRLRFPDGRIQMSVGAFPSVREVFLMSTFLYLLLPRNYVIMRRGSFVFDPDREREVDYLCGAFLMIRRSLIDTIGVLDPQFFMYSEEVDFCRRARESGAGVWYTPAGTVMHYWGGMSAVSRKGVVWLVASQFLYYRKYHRGAERFLLEALRITGLGLRVLVYAVAGLVTADKRLLAKSSYAATAAFLMLTGPPERVWKLP
jgi:GT2 family glycosyltransferase